MTKSLEANYLGMPLELSERDVDNRAFFGFCANGEYRLQCCNECGLLRYPPSPSCPWCAGSECRWVPVDGAGTVYSYMEVHQAIQPAFRAAVPFLILLVELDTQRGMPSAHESLRVIGNLVDSSGRLVRADQSQAGIGTRVRLMSTPIASGLALPQWTVAQGDNASQAAWRYPG